MSRRMEPLFSEKIIFGKTLSETWYNMLSQFKNTKIMLGLVTVIENPLAEDEWPKEIDEEVRRQGYNEVEDYLVGPVPSATADRVDKQLDDAISALNTQGCEERAIILTLRPSDLVKSVRLDRSQELPIFTYLDFKKIEEKLYLIASLRNCEVFVKWVMDVLWLSKQMENALNKTNLKCGALILFADKAYIEEKDYEKVRKIIEQAPTKS